MIIAFDTSPLYNNNKNRGVGKYTQKLQEEFKKYSLSCHSEHIRFAQYKLREESLKILEFHQPQSIPPCDLIHYPYFDPFYLTLPLFKKYPTVVTIHDLIPLVYPKKFPRGIKGEFKWQVQKQSLKSVKAIITDSQVSKKDIIKFTGINEDKIHVVYLAPLLTDIKISEKEIRDFKEKHHLPDKFLLYIGDINYNKNLPNLYKSLKLINCHCEERSKEVEPQRNPANGGTIYLVLVGSSFLNNSLPEKKELDRLAEELDIENSLVKLGGLTNKEIKILYQLATAYIQPSLYEGFGLPVVEALSAGCPVICSDRGSLPEVAKDTVIYINPDDPQNIADSIEKILHFDNQTRQTIIEKGKIQSANFSWKNTIQQTIKIYKEVLGK